MSKGYRKSRAKVQQYGLTIDLRGQNYDIEEVRNLRKKLAKRANARLATLEKHGYTKNAYRIATRYTVETRGKKRFSEGMLKKAGIEYLRDEIEALREFLTSKSSTIKGNKEIEKERLEFFRGVRKVDKEGKLTGLGLVISGSEEFFKFLNSTEYKALANKMISSNVLMEFYDSVKESNDDVKYEELLKALEEYRKGKVKSVDDLYEQFDLKFME